MFIGLCGALCAGKHSVAKYLVDNHGFQVLRLVSPASTPLPKAEDDLNIFLPRFPETSSDIGTFQSVEALVDYVTPRWQEHFVTTEVWSEDILEALLKRPFFILVSIDAPIMARWKRYSQKCEEHKIAVPTLEAFVEKSDRHMFNRHTGLIPLFSRATLRLLNPSSSLDELYKSLETINLTDEGRLRPTWDAYFMQLANLAAQRSNCMKRRVGCVLVREKRVISTGYNGTPRGLTNCNEAGCERCNGGSVGGSGLSTCLCLHAEENALLEAGRERISKGSILYCDTCPCLTCSVKIVQVGISEVVYSQAYSMDNKTADVLESGGVKLTQFSPPREGVVFLGV